MRPSRTLLRAMLVSCLLLAGVGVAQESVQRPAVPLDPVASIVEAFETHDLVALTTRGYVQEYDFWMTLLHSPDFQAAVDDVVVEFGTARYQNLMDRYTSGERVPYAELKNVWQQTTQPHHVSDSPMYEGFFRAVREINAARTKGRLRVLLAEPPIDWSNIQDYEDLLPWLQRRFPFEAELVEREVLTKGRKALLISGAGHYLDGTPLLKTIRAHGKDVLKVWTVIEESLIARQPSILSWPTPSFAFIADTPLGGFELDPGIAPPYVLEQEYDAVLYLGPPSRLAPDRLAPELCSDQEYLDMRLPRLRMAAENGAPDWLAEFLEYCQGVERR